MRPGHFLAACSYIWLAASTQTVLATETELGKTIWELGSGFVLAREYDQLEITREELSIWSTTTHKPFISASAATDLVTGSNGAFNITQVDIDPTDGQDIISIQLVDWRGSVTGYAAQVNGHLIYSGSVCATYSLHFWVPHNLTDRVAFYLTIESSVTDTSGPLEKLYFRFNSRAGEDFYGLGGQASFASLKNQSIPILSREQGVGRGDEPITSIQNANGSIAGGDFYTAYTAIPSYVSTDGNLFYLSEKSTAYANFDFMESDTHDPL